MAEAPEQLPTPDETPQVEAPPAADGAPATEDAAAEAAPVEGDDDVNSKRVTLADLSAKGTALYAHKNFDEAAEVFSRASVLQAEINGETSPQNAEILFHYGRSLFRVGQLKSDVLGGPTAAAEKKKPAKRNGQPPKPQQPLASRPAKTDAEQVTQEGVGIVAELKEGDGAGGAGAKEEPAANKPLFQFTGDENFDDSDEDDEPEGDGEDDQEEDDDDLATAFEVLDLARVCYIKLLDEADGQDQAGKGKEVAQDSPSVRHIKERLADTHDALAEISLENERYPNAIEDGRVSLKYKVELYPAESEIVAEAHYKLSLALEFASITTSGGDGAPAKREAMDQDLRDEAVREMELAIESFRLKMQNREVDLATMASPEDNELARKSIQEMKEVIADMEQRLVDLRNDPIDASDLMGGDANPLGGILGAALGESAADTQARVDAAKKTATDLTGLVRKKAKDDAPAAETNGKRKAEEPAGEAPKKAKVEGGDAEEV